MGAAARQVVMDLKLGARPRDPRRRRPSPALHRRRARAISTSGSGPSRNLRADRRRRPSCPPDVAVVGCTAAGDRASASGRAATPAHSARSRCATPSGDERARHRRHRRADAGAVMAGRARLHADRVAGRRLRSSRSVAAALAQTLVVAQQARASSARWLRATQLAEERLERLRAGDRSDDGGADRRVHAPLAGASRPTAGRPRAPRHRGRRGRTAARSVSRSRRWRGAAMSQICRLLARRAARRHGLLRLFALARASVCTRAAARRTRPGSGQRGAGSGAARRAAHRRRLRAKPASVRAGRCPTACAAPAPDAVSPWRAI